MPRILSHLGVPSLRLRIALLLTFAVIMVAAGAWATQPAQAQLPGTAPLGATQPGERADTRSDNPQASGPAGSSVVKAPPPAAPNVILYDQLNNAGTLSTGSQQFEPGFASFNDQTADD